jgi:ribonuclease Z
VVVEREGETLLFDCGEGTQRQMMRYGVSFALNDIFFSHFHADHFLGLPGLLRTMALQGRSDALHAWGPSGATRVLRQAASLGAERPTFPLQVHELEPGAVVKRGDYSIVAVSAVHRGPTTLTYGIVEDERRGRFNPARARELGIPEGPLWGRIHKGESVRLDDGRVIDASALVGPTRHGRRVVITGDTRPCEATVELSRGADLLVHEATFAEEEAERARETGHSTAREAADVAVRAGVRRLVLTHLSARYTRYIADLEREARAVFPATVIARDGMEIEVRFADETDLGEPAVLASEQLEADHSKLPRGASR